MSSKVSKKFIQALADSDNMKLFQTIAVKKLIDFLWPVILRFTVLMLFIPYILMLSLYIWYSHFEFEGTDGYVLKDYFKFKGQGPILKISVVIALTALCLYFIIIEVIQLWKQKFWYFLSVWNYLDLVPTLLILLQIYLDVFGVNYEESPTLKIITRSVTNLLIWLKLLYFLRIF